jgi:TP901 family phage tail tape measure protein
VATVADLSVHIGADVADAERGIRSVTSNLGLIGGAAKAAAVGLLAVGGGVAAGLGVAAKSAADFEKQMSGVQAVSGASRAEMEQLSGLALQLGKDTSFSASQAAQGLGELVKGGVQIPDIMNGAAQATLDLAAAGGVDLATAAGIAANAMSIFNLTGSDMGNVVNKIAGYANATTGDVGDFSLSLKQVGAAAHLAGQDFDSTATAIALMADKGILGSDAGTSLKTMLLNLQPSTKSAANEMKALGLITADGSNKFVDAQGHIKGMADISGVLHDATQNLTDAQKLQALQTVFGTDAIRAAAIMADAGKDGFNKMADAMGRVSASDVAKIRLDNLAGDVEQLSGSWDTFLIELGRTEQGALRGAVQGLTSLVNSAIPFAQTYGPAIVTTLQDAGRAAGQFAIDARTGAGSALQWLQERLDESGRSWATWAAGAGPAGQAAGLALSGVTGLAQALAFVLQGNLPAATVTAQGALGNLGGALDIVKQGALNLWGNVVTLGQAWGGVFQSGATLALNVARPLGSALLSGAQAASGLLGPVLTVGAAAAVVLAPALLSAAAGLIAHNVQASLAATILTGRTILAVVQSSGAFYIQAAGATFAAGALAVHAAASAAAYVAAFGLIPTLVLGAQMFGAWATAATVAALRSAAAWATAALPVTIAVGLIAAAAIVWNTNLFGMRDAVTSFAGGVVEKLGEVIGFIGNLGRAVGLPVDQWITDFNRLKDNTGRAMDETKTQVGNAVGGMKQVVSGGTLDMASVTAQNSALMKQAMAQNSGAMASSTTADFQRMQRETIAQMQAMGVQVPASMAALARDTTAASAAATTPIRDDWATAGKSVQDSTKAMYDGSVADFQRLESDSLASVDTLAASTSATMTVLAGTMKAQAQDGADGALANISSLVNGIFALAPAAYSAGYSVGSSIADGMVVAVRSRSADVAAQASSMVTQAITAARVAADAHSPSRETEKLGEDIVAGLVLGIDTTSDDAKNAATAMTNAVSLALAQGVAEIRGEVSDISGALSGQVQKLPGQAVGQFTATLSTLREMAPLAAQVAASQQAFAAAGRATAAAEGNVTQLQAEMSRASLEQDQRLLPLQGLLLEGKRQLLDLDRQDFPAKQRLAELDQQETRIQEQNLTNARQLLVLDQQLLGSQQQLARLDLAKQGVGLNHRGQDLDLQEQTLKIQQQMLGATDDQRTALQKQLDDVQRQQDALRIQDELERVGIDRKGIAAQASAYAGAVAEQALKQQQEQTEAQQKLDLNGIELEKAQIKQTLKDHDLQRIAIQQTMNVQQLEIDQSNLAFEQQKIQMQSRLVDAQLWLAAKQREQAKAEEVYVATLKQFVDTAVASGNLTGAEAIETAKRLGLWDDNAKGVRAIEEAVKAIPTEWKTTYTIETVTKGGAAAPAGGPNFAGSISGAANTISSGLNAAASAAASLASSLPSGGGGGGGGGGTPDYSYDPGGGNGTVYDSGGDPIVYDEFASGGIVTRPTFALIGEGGESEAVIPLSRLSQMVGGGGAVQIDYDRLAAAVLNGIRAGGPLPARVDGTQAVGALSDVLQRNGQSRLLAR